MFSSKTIKCCLTNLSKRHLSLCQPIYQNPREGLLNNDNVESSLWFTTLPSKRKNALLMNKKKRKHTPSFIPTGPPIIVCKDEKLNHYSGQNYDNLDSVTLASKGWFSNKSKGDHFTIRSTTTHPAFIMTKSDLSIAAGTFEEAGLDDWLVNILKTLGKEKPTTIQAKGIPRILAGRNTLLVSETGCGKTFAYLLPMIQRVARWKKMTEDERPDNCPLGFIVVPNRELAVQIGTVAKTICDKTHVVCQTILGGHTSQLLKNPVMENVDIVVATLGVISKLTTHFQYRTSFCKHLVLDEADTLLDDSFNEKLVHFLRRFPIQSCGPEDERELPSGTQISLVSATMPTSLNDLIGTLVNMDSLERISTKYLHRVLPHVPQTFLRVGKSQKPQELLKLIRSDINNNKPAMIFSNKTEACDFVAGFLNENGIPCERLNSRIPVDYRFGKYRRFSNGDVDFISCTDMTSRGIDSTRVKHVINFDFPLYMADYIHRCGRTGRIGHDENCSVTNLISSRREIDLVQQIEKAARTFRELHNVNNNISRIIQYKSRENNPETPEKANGAQLESTGL